MSGSKTSKPTTNKQPEAQTAKGSETVKKTKLEKERVFRDLVASSVVCHSVNIENPTMTTLKQLTNKVVEMGNNSSDPEYYLEITKAAVEKHGQSMNQHGLSKVLGIVKRTEEFIREWDQ